MDSPALTVDLSVAEPLAWDAVVGNGALVLVERARRAVQLVRPIKAVVAVVALVHLVDAVAVATRVLARRTLEAADLVGHVSAVVRIVAQVYDEDALAVGALELVQGTVAVHLVRGVAAMGDVVAHPLPRDAASTVARKLVGPAVVRQNPTSRRTHLSLLALVASSHLQVVQTSHAFVLQNEALLRNVLVLGNCTFIGTLRRLQQILLLYPFCDVILDCLECETPRSPEQKNCQKVFCATVHFAQFF